MRKLLLFILLIMSFSVPHFYNIATAAAVSRVGTDRSLPLPRGYMIQNEPGGSGRLVTATLPVNSARQLLVKSLRDISGLFEGRPKVSGAFADRDDRTAQAAFTASVQGHPFAGMLVVTIVGGGGRVAALFDRLERFPVSMSRLMALAVRAFPTGLRPTAWRDVHLQDGGSMRLPEGWTVTGSNQGMVDVAGPEGACASFGIWFPVNVPGSVPAHLSSRVLVAPYTGPVEAVLNLAPQFAARYGNGAPAPRIRVIETIPADQNQFPRGKAAFVHCESDTGGTTISTLALVITAPTGQTTWLYYFSQVQAPKAVFQQRLPEMLEIWKNWHISDQVLRDRLDAAVRSMREIHQMIGSNATSLDRVFDNAQADWIEYIRGERYERDTLTGEMRVRPLYDIRKIIEKKNEMEGYQRYEEVPLRDFN